MHLRREHNTTPDLVSCIFTMNNCADLQTSDLQCFRVYRRTLFLFANVGMNRYLIITALWLVIQSLDCLSLNILF